MNDNELAQDVVWGVSGFNIEKATGESAATAIVLAAFETIRADERRRCAERVFAMCFCDINGLCVKDDAIDIIMAGGE